MKKAVTVATLVASLYCANCSSNSDDMPLAEPQPPQTKAIEYAQAQTRPSAPQPELQDWPSQFASNGTPAASLAFILGDDAIGKDVLQYTSDMPESPYDAQTTKQLRINLIRGLARESPENIRHAYKTLDTIFDRTYDDPDIAKEWGAVIFDSNTETSRYVRDRLIEEHHGQVRRSLIIAAEWYSAEAVKNLDQRDEYAKRAKRLLELHDKLERY